MFRQSPRRNGRSKGLKIKHVLQISVLLGVSIWLVYQVHHPHDKKPPGATAIADKLQNDSNSDGIKLGRKDLRPKEKDANVTDKKEAQERQGDEEGDENESEEIAQDHENEEGEDGKREEVGENEKGSDGEDRREKDGIEKMNEMEKEHEQIKAENEEVKEKETGDKKEKTKERSRPERMKHARHEGRHRGHRDVKKKTTKEEKGSEEEVKGKVNEKKSNEQNQVVVLEKAGENPKEVEISVPSEDHDQVIRESNHEDKAKLLDDFQNATRTEENGENRVQDETNDTSNVGSSPTASVENENEKVVNFSTQRDSKMQAILSEPTSREASSDLYSVPSLEPAAAKSLNGNSSDSVEKVEEQVPNGESFSPNKNMNNGESEKDDGRTLPESGAG